MTAGTPSCKDDVLKALPEQWPVDLRSEIHGQVRASGRKVVVLDDDPTGNQTVHGLPVLTGWSVEVLREELLNDLPAFFTLTNSRSLPLPEARRINEDIGKNLVEAARRTKRDFVVISRSDSTLRGHFPGEVEALSRALGRGFHGWIIIPFFPEGGRYTIGDTHYVDEGGRLVPAAETEFAGDTVFGYSSSNLRHWVQEKTGGRIPSGDVLSITIEDIRRGGPDRIVRILEGMDGGRMCVVNAASYRDLEVLVVGLLRAEASGKRFLYRTAASFVQVRAGIVPRPLLSRRDLSLSRRGGGLIVVGSHVPRTTTQLRSLIRVPRVRAVETNVETLMHEARWDAEIARVAQTAQTAMEKGEDALVYTSRTVLSTGEAESDLLIGHRVSRALIATVQRISAEPRYLLAKGGITASDLATRALGVKRAMVLGQLLPGVPVWQLGDESRHPGMPYVVFPGNVGGPDALVEAVKRLSGC